jgi:hypothetical protein
VGSSIGCLGGDSDGLVNYSRGLLCKHDNTATVCPNDVLLRPSRSVSSGGATVEVVARFGLV